MKEGSGVASRQDAQATTRDKLPAGCDLASPKLGNNRQKPNLPQGRAVFVSAGRASSAIALSCSG